MVEDEEEAAAAAVLLPLPCADVSALPLRAAAICWLTALRKSS